jgi:tetrahydromethanopterin S-methyltransferase subunit G
VKARIERLHKRVETAKMLAVLLNPEEYARVEQELEKQERELSASWNAFRNRFGKEM